VLLTATTASAAAGVTSHAGRAQDRVQAALAYARYLVTAALIPLALWAVGAFSRLGIA
jgi:hypothetical protein